MDLADESIFTLEASCPPFLLCRTSLTKEKHGEVKRKARLGLTNM